jgi:uncharacterized protein DUF433
MRFLKSVHTFESVASALIDGSVLLREVVKAPPPTPRIGLQRPVPPSINFGTPVFVGTRVPLQNLIDSLEGGESIEDLDGFPSVKRPQVLAVIEAGS